MRHALIKGVDSPVAGPQVLLPAGRTASVTSMPDPTQPAMTLPEPSTPSTMPPLCSVPRVTGAPQLPPAGRTAASGTVLPFELDAHSATVCPAGVTATTMPPPWPRSAACQVFPFVLVHTSTFAVPPEVVKVPPAAMTPAGLSATELPHDPGRASGADHERLRFRRHLEIRRILPARPGP
jgi:hypothetical protein